MNQTPITEPPPSPSRRAFYLTFIYGVQAVIGATLAAFAIPYLFFPPRAKKESEWVDAADLSKIPANKPQEVSFQRNRVDGWKVITEKSTAWVVKQSDSQVIAFAPQCTHLGCAYHWDDPSNTFVCPCHTSAFSVDGRVLSGPAPRPLDRYAVRIEGTKLELGAVEHHA